MHARESIVGKGQLKDHDDFMTVLDDLAAKSCTAKMWVDAFIKPESLCLSVLSPSMI